uniref:G_PROTEIN_RECEP_F1_2 domain-containing protein n=1 Tax=Steinernema glaseri TaxID=37863 RepID=A0A1I7ZLT3_9BILA
MVFWGLSLWDVLTNNALNPLIAGGARVGAVRESDAEAGEERLARGVHHREPLHLEAHHPVHPVGHPLDPLHRPERARVAVDLLEQPGAPVVPLLPLALQHDARAAELLPAPLLPPQRRPPPLLTRIFLNKQSYRRAYRPIKKLDRLQPGTLRGYRTDLRVPGHKKSHKCGLKENLTMLLVQG